VAGLTIPPRESIYLPTDAVDGEIGARKVCGILGSKDLPIEVSES